MRIRGFQGSPANDVSIVESGVKAAASRHYGSPLRMLLGFSLALIERDHFTSLQMKSIHQPSHPTIAFILRIMLSITSIVVMMQDCCRLYSRSRASMSLRRPTSSLLYSHIQVFKMPNPNHSRLLFRFMRLCRRLER
jgi:hypothetical protein